MKACLQLLFCFLLVNSPNFVFGQDAPTGEIEDAQIIIEKDKDLTLPKANRTYKKITVLPISTEIPAVSYSISNPEFQLPTFQNEVTVRDYKNEPIGGASTNFVKLGFGNYISPIIQGYYGFSKQENAFGVWLDHESFARGPVREEESAYAETTLRLDASSQLADFNIEPKLQYNRESYYLYGYDESIANPLLLTDRVVANDFQVNVLLASAFSSKPKWSWFIDPSLRFTDMRAAENSLNQELIFSTDLGARLSINDGLKGSIESNYTSLSYSSGLSENRFVYNLNPSVNWSSDMFAIKAGFDFTLSKDTSSSDVGTHIYPDIEIKWLTSEKLSVFAKAEGRMSPTSLSMAQRENRYLNDSLNFLNENLKLRVTAGLDFMITENLSISPFVSYSATKNKMLFIGSSNDSSRFELVYDGGDFGQVDLGSTLSFRKGKSELVASLIYSSYQSDLVAEAWYLPETQLFLRYDQGLGDAVSLFASMNVMDGIKGYNPTLRTAEDLLTILDINLGADYQINDSFSAFATFQNLISQEYFRYLNYPSRGITGKIGFIYRL